MSAGRKRTEQLSRIEQFIRNDPSLTDLNLSCNSRYDDYNLPITLSTNTTVRTLNLSKNSIRDEYVQELASALLLNTTLCELDLSYNSLINTNKGVIALAQALSGNKNLRSLKLKNNCIYKIGVQALVHALSSENNTLTELDLSANHFGNEAAMALVPLIRDNTSLRSLNIEDNCISYETAKAFALALKGNTTLTSLELGIIPDPVPHQRDVGSESAGSIMKSINKLLERNNIIKQFSEAVENGDVSARLNLLIKLKEKYPSIDDPILPHPQALVEVYRDYNTLHPGDFTPKAVIALFTGSSLCLGPTHMLEINTALAAYLFTNILSFPADIQKNGFRMILWLLRYNLHDEELETMIKISLKGAESTLEDWSPLQVSAALPHLHFNPAAIRVEDEKQIIVDHLISTLALEEQLPYRCDVLVKQATALSCRFVSNSEWKTHFYSSNAPEGITHRVYKALSDYLALPTSSKCTVEELTRLEDIVRSRLVLDERAQFHNSNDKYASEIAELKTVLATIAKMKNSLKHPQEHAQAQLVSAQQLLVQQAAELSKCTEERLTTDLAHLQGYPALPESARADVLARLEATLSRRRAELAMQPPASGDSEPSDVTKALKRDRKLFDDQVGKISDAITHENASLYKLITKLVESCRTANELPQIHRDVTDKQLKELMLALEEGVRHCQALKRYGHLALLDDVNGKLNQHTELVTELKEVVQRCQPMLVSNLKLLNNVDEILDQLTKLIADIEGDAKICRSRMHSYGSFAHEAGVLAGEVENKRTQLTWLIVELEAGLNQLAELEDELSRERLRKVLIEDYLQVRFEFRHVEECFTRVKESLYRRRHDMVSQPHHNGGRCASKMHEIDDLEAAIAMIDKINTYKSELNFENEKMKTTTLANTNKRTNEIDKLAAILSTIAKIKRLQTEVNVEQALGQEHASLIKQMTALSQCTKRGKGEFSLTIFTSSAKTSVESMRKTYDAYLTKEPSEQIAAAVLGQLIQDLQARQEYVSAPLRMQYHEAEIDLLGQVMRTMERITMIQAPVVLPSVSAASAAAAPVVVSASIAPPRAGM